MFPKDFCNDFERIFLLVADKYYTVSKDKHSSTRLWWKTLYNMVSALCAYLDLF